MVEEEERKHNEEEGVSRQGQRRVAKAGGRRAFTQRMSSRRRGAIGRGGVADEGGSFFQACTTDRKRDYADSLCTGGGEKESPHGRFAYHKELRRQSTPNPSNQAHG